MNAIWLSQTFRRCDIEYQLLNKHHVYNLLAVTFSLLQRHRKCQATAQRQYLIINTIYNHHAQLQHKYQ